jgi:alkylation response protein AidB-like acyl-CoA dehydrogenase
MCDAHLMLARTENGLSCFFVPRWLPDGTRNPILVQRLKDKLGNRSNSSSEVEFEEAMGIMVGADGRGITTIIEMANHTRLDCVIGSAALMRQALVQAIHHARHRSAFGRLLAEQPLMRNVLCDLALESEAATMLMLRLAHAFDAPDDRCSGPGNASSRPPPSSGSASVPWNSPANAWKSGAATATWRPGRWRACTGGPGQFDLGGFGQCDVPGCAARHWP